MLMRTADIEASLYRYLYEHLERDAYEPIHIFEDIVSVSYDAYRQWLVVDSLSSPTGDQPKQHFFLHAAQQKGAPRAKDTLNRIVDRVLALIEQGTEIEIFDSSLDQDVVIGVMVVSNTSLSPILQHKGGGSMRSLSVTVVYPSEYPNEL
jgi:hypothetical protein